MFLKISAEIKAVGKDLSHGISAPILKRIYRAGEGKAVDDVHTGRVFYAVAYTHEYPIERRRAEYAVEHRAFDAFLRHDGDGDNAEYGNDKRHDRAVSGGAEEVERSKLNDGSRADLAVYYRRVGRDKSDVLHTDKGDKQTDTGRDRNAHRLGYRVKQHLTQSRHGKDDKHQTVYKDQHQSICIRKTERKANGIDKERVKSHTACLRHRQSCEQSHQHRTYDSGKRSRDVDRAESGTGYTEHTCVYGQYVHHRHKRNKSADDLRLKGRPRFLDAEEVIELLQELIRLFRRRSTVAVDGNSFVRAVFLRLGHVFCFVRRCGFRFGLFDGLTVEFVFTHGKHLLEKDIYILP